MLKKALDNQEGMALVTVIAIIAVITILATGAFVFSTTELKLSQIDLHYQQAKYLARGGIEIASKALPEVIKNNPNFETRGDYPQGVSGSPAPITATVYLHKNSTSGEKEDTYIINSNPLNALGFATITAQESEKEVVIVGTNGTDGPQKQMVYLYEATSQVHDSKATLKGYSVLPISAYSMGLLHKNGSIDATLLTQPPYVSSSSNEVNGLLDWIRKLLGGNPKVYAANYPNGVLTVSKAELDSGAKLYLSSTQDLGCVWNAESVLVEIPVDLRNGSGAKGIGFCAQTMVFEEEVHLWKNRFLPLSNWGTLVLAPQNSEGSTIYFKNNVYVYSGNNRRLLLEKGTYHLKEKIDLLNESTADLAKKLVKVTDKPAPTEASLTKVIWE